MNELPITTNYFKLLNSILISMTLLSKEIVNFETYQLQFVDMVYQSFILQYLLNVNFISHKAYTLLLDFLVESVSFFLSLKLLSSNSMFNVGEKFIEPLINSIESYLNNQHELNNVHKSNENKKLTSLFGGEREINIFDQTDTNFNQLHFIISFSLEILMKLADRLMDHNMIYHKFIFKIYQLIQVYYFTCKSIILELGNSIIQLIKHSLAKLKQFLDLKNDIDVTNLCFDEIGNYNIVTINSFLFSDLTDSFENKVEFSILENIVTQFIEEQLQTKYSSNMLHLFHEKYYNVISMFKIQSQLINNYLKLKTISGSSDVFSVKETHFVNYSTNELLIKFRIYNSSTIKISEFETQLEIEDSNLISQFNPNPKRSYYETEYLFNGSNTYSSINILGYIDKSFSIDLRSFGRCRLTLKILWNDLQIEDNSLFFQIPLEINNLPENLTLDREDNSSFLMREYVRNETVNFEISYFKLSFFELVRPTSKSMNVSDMKMRHEIEFSVHSSIFLLHDFMKFPSLLDIILANNDLQSLPNILSPTSFEKSSTTCSLKWKFETLWGDFVLIQLNFDLILLETNGMMKCCWKGELQIKTSSLENLRWIVSNNLDFLVSRLTFGLLNCNSKEVKAFEKICVNMCN